ncbi:MAG TPA: glycosyltransferase, partial [Anaerolineae bacterium]|nr:glycosyltransferase [Anaerolineae bacterium]
PCGSAVRTARGAGDNAVRIFAAFQHFNWEAHNLAPALRELGDLTWYDWHAEDWYDQYHPQWHILGKTSMNMELARRVQDAHQVAPLDVFYGYLCGRLIHRGYITYIREGLAIPTLNMTLDDKTHRYSALEPTGFAGMVDIASAFDLCWTSDPTAVAWYEQHGARAIYLPAGANPDVFVPRECARDIGVLFVGKCYGRRAEIVQGLQQRGVDVQAYGQGWPNGPVSTEAMVDLMNRAIITLGIGETTDPALLLLKGRDFEAPMCGAFYLAQDNPELATHYDIGGEIVTWRDVPDLADKCRYYLAHPQEVEQIRRAGAARARAEHTWRRRFEDAFRALGVM